MKLTQDEVVKAYARVYGRWSTLASGVTVKDKAVMLKSSWNIEYGPKFSVIVGHSVELTTGNVNEAIECFNEWVD